MAEIVSVLISGISAAYLPKIIGYTISLLNQAKELTWDLFVSRKEFQLLPKLARSQPIVDKAKLQNASSVEEALDIARSSLPVEATV